jgi:hypothetical protein
MISLHRHEINMGKGAAVEPGSAKPMAILTWFAMPTWNLLLMIFPHY